MTFSKSGVAGLALASVTSIVTSLPVKKCVFVVISFISTTAFIEWRTPRLFTMPSDEPCDLTVTVTLADSTLLGSRLRSASAIRTCSSLPSRISSGLILRSPTFEADTGTLNSLVPLGALSI